MRRRPLLLLKRNPNNAVSKSDPRQEFPGTSNSSRSNLQRDILCQGSKILEKTHSPGAQGAPPVPSKTAGMYILFSPPQFSTCGRGIGRLSSILCCTHSCFLLASPLLNRAPHSRQLIPSSMPSCIAGAVWKRVMCRFLLAFWYFPLNVWLQSPQGRSGSGSGSSFIKVRAAVAAVFLIRCFLGLDGRGPRYSWIEGGIGIGMGGLCS